LDLLTKKGGFVCFLLHKTFVDSYYHSGHNQDLRGTDLCKYCLNFSSFYREDYKNRSTHVRSLRDEFTKFLELYGAASSYFVDHNHGLDLRKIAEINRSVVGMVLFDREFFIPSLVPENTNDRIIEYFSILCEALTSSFNKLRIEIPSWLSQISFEKENTLIQKKQSLIEEIEATDNELAKYTQYKKVLLGSGEILVENVSNLLKSGFGFKVDSEDEFKEDLKIINDDNDPLVFVEVKGTNRGVKREYINQTDSHRERAGLNSTLPSLLVINTHIKNSASIKDKDQIRPEDQIKHATRIGVLIVRTLDLLFMLRHLSNGKVSQQKIMDLFLNNVGWLKVGVDNWEIIQ